ncbi:hypothetical protein [Methanoculleus sp.]
MPQSGSGQPTIFSTIGTPTIRGTPIPPGEFLLECPGKTGLKILLEGI